MASRSHNKRIYIFFASIFLLIFFWSTQSTPWFRSRALAKIDTAQGYTALILYLTRLSEAAELLESLASVNRNLPGHPWPIVLFHTGDFDDESQRTDFIYSLRDHIGEANGSRAFSERIEFVKLDWQLPEGISSDIEVVNPVHGSRWPGMLASLITINYLLTDSQSKTT